MVRVDFTLGFSIVCSQAYLVGKFAAAPHQCTASRRRCSCSGTLEDRELTVAGQKASHRKEPMPIHESGPCHRHCADQRDGNDRALSIVVFPSSGDSHHAVIPDVLRVAVGIDTAVVNAFQLAMESIPARPNRA